MTVTGITEWKKDRMLISLNDEPAFVLYKREVKEYSIREGEDLTAEKYEEILEKVLIKRAKSRTLHILDRFDKTEHELRNKLKEDMYPEEAIDAAVEAAKKGRYLDDLRYASQYIYEKSKSKSLKKIEAELIGKGIDRSVLSESMKRFSEDEEESGESREDALILKIIEKRIPKGTEPDPEAEAKLIRYLLGKGFEYGKVKKILAKKRSEIMSF